MVITKTVRVRSVAVDTDRSVLITVIMFSAIGLLLSLGVVLLDQYVPGDWF